MIKANFNAYGSYVTDSVTQWDKNQILSVTGLNLVSAPEVHFSNANMRSSIVRQAKMEDHIVEVKIPNSLLQQALIIKAEIGVYEGETFKTVEVVEIPVRAAKIPEDYTISDDEEIYSFNRLENELANKATNARVDNIIAHNNKTDGNTELLDIRTDVDGVTHGSAGEAVRNQAKIINDRINYLTGNLMSSNLFNADSVENVNGAYLNYRGDEVVVGSSYAYSHFISVIPGETYISKRYDSALGSDSQYIIAYDRNENYKSFITCEKVTSNGVACNKFICPSGVYFVRVNYLSKSDFMFVIGDEYPKTYIEYYDVKTDHEKIKHFTGKTIVNFGDSIFGLEQAPNDISSYLRDIIGGTIHNAAFGGCRMGAHSNANYDAFSMYRLAYAIANNDWSLQNAVIGNTALPNYFSARLAALKEIDFNTVDVITIAYGTNDFVDGLQPGEFVETGSNQFNYFTTALKYSIETIQNAFPSVKIFVITPIWRCWVENGKVVDDGNTKEVESWVSPGGNTKLIDFVTACYEGAKENQIPVIDNYNIGINKFNHSYYLSDTTHPNENGRKLIAKNLAKYL